MSGALADQAAAGVVIRNLVPPVASRRSRTARATLRTLALAAMLVGAWVPAPVGSSVPARPDEPPPVRPFSCTERLRLPTVANVMDAVWSPDSTTLALSWFTKLPSTRSVTGYEEGDTILDTFDVRTGAVRALGVGDRPAWSASGTYVSYWGPNGDELRVTRDGRVRARLLATIPDARWVGDTLFFFEKDEIRAWSGGAVSTVARLEEEFVPRYPRDDVYFSADAERFTLTRYSLDGTLERYIGVTRTGAVAPLEDGGAAYIEWAPTGATLLLRHADRLELRGPGGDVRSAPLASFPGLVQAWTPDGRALLIGRVSPTVPGGDAFDTFTVWGAPQPESLATLPDLVGARSFSPNGKLFTGVSRTGLDGTQLEVYRCGTRGDAESAGRDHETAARGERIAADTRRFVRPAAGPISQFLQGRHTGIDVAAPLGSLIVASDDGTVSAVGWHPFGGQRACLAHSGGLESCYYHISAALVSVGDRVVRGEPIAMIGMTGVTTGPHVHWEAKVFGRIVDPLTR